MKNKILLSIVIPTYNRATFLERILNNIVSQAFAFRNKVEICISNNASTDNTSKIIKDFKMKYPDLIQYNENKKNQGFDRNLLEAISMAGGDFVWTLGDDDYIVDNGLKEVVEFLEKKYKENIGLLILGTESFFIDDQTGKKIVYNTTLFKDKPEILKIDKKDIITAYFPGGAFISGEIFNNKLLKEMFKEDKMIIEQGIGTGYIQIILYTLMFLKYPDIVGARLNKKIVCEEMPYYKFFIEDIFSIHYCSRKKIKKFLLDNKYMNNRYVLLIIKKYKKLRRNIIGEMLQMKAFKTFNYLSFFGCLKLFFQKAVFIDALLFSIFFLIFSLIPSNILKNAYKIYLKIKHKENWQQHWLCLTITLSKASKGERRIATH